MALWLLRRVRLSLVLAPLIGFGCSSDERRDQNYGTDAAAGYTGPEAGLAEAGTTQGATDANDSEDADETSTNFDDSAKDTAESADATLDPGPPL